LRQQRQQLENQLYRLFPALKIEGVSTAQVAAALRGAAPRGLLVEFQIYRPYGKGAKGKAEWGAKRYVALLLKPDGTIRAIPLGEAAPIDAAVSMAVTASAAANRQAEAPERLAAVSRLVLTPLQKELAGVTELFLSLDGELNRLPFAALPMAAGDGPTLGESVQLRLLTTGRELVRLSQPAKTGGVAVLVANPDFNAAGGSSSRPPSHWRRVEIEGTAAVSAIRGGPTRSPGMGGMLRWEPLTGTESEADQLAPLLRLRPDAVISGPQATAALVLRQKAPRILHIATHGFFQDEQLALPGLVRAAILPAGPPALNRIDTGAPRLDDPLQRSGLVFAGANHPDANPADDGYLTAAEATAMDLEGTELVTLSACETGLGGVRSGEGVYGLQRSLAVAGARSTLLSLWKVDDARTATFLALYYQRLKAGEGRADALRHTQAFFRSNKDTNLRDVRVWGAFQLSGDWRPIQRW
jgi:CHAT domain-containing protein